MAVLNVTGFKLVSAEAPSHSTGRTRDARKQFSLPLPSFSQLPPVASAISSGVVLLNNIVGNGAAGALTYEEALQQSMEGSSLYAAPDLDVGGLVDGLVSFGADNAPLVAGGIVLLAIPLVLSWVLKQKKRYGVVSASTAFEKLSEDDSAQLVDIREKLDVKEGGSPDGRKLKKKPVSLVYDGDDKPGFLEKISLRFKEPGETTLYILDKYDGNSELVAELVTLNGFKEAYAIRDGAEGPEGWKRSGLPWIAPRRSLGVDLAELREALSNAIGDNFDGSALALGVAAAAGVGSLVFTEAETVLQVLGSAAIVQFVTRKLLYAEDRKKTLQELDEFFNNKVAPADLIEEIKLIVEGLVPTSNEKGSPARSKESVVAAPVTVVEKPVEEEPAAATTQINSIPVAKDVLEAVIIPVAKAEEEPVRIPVAEAEEELNEEEPVSIPVTKAEKEAVSGGHKQPQSPYPNYPDLKPPSSPSPRQA